MAMEGLGIFFKKQFLFRPTFARIYMGNGHYFANKLASGDKETGDPQTEKNDLDYIDYSSMIVFQMEALDGSLQKILGTQPAGAFLYKCPQGQISNSAGHSVSGDITIYDCESETNKEDNYVDLNCLLKPATFDSLTTAIYTGGRELLSKATLLVQLNIDRDKFQLSKGDNLFQIPDLAIYFDIGSKRDR